MPTGNLTTKEVARLLQVSEATVKRWADDGVLRSKKTVGGHRRFSIQSNARLRREQRIEPESPPGGREKKDIAGTLLSVPSFTELLLRADEAETAAVLIDAYLKNRALPSLFDTTITEAMHRIGELWFTGEITVADEHAATRVLLNALQELRSIILPGAPKGLKAICCGIEGDLHELPIHLAEMILESEGWDTTNLGPNTPLYALRDMMVQKRPQLVCIAARSVLDLDRATTEYAKLRKVNEKLGAVAVLGGEGFRDPTLRERFQADFYGESFAAFSSFLRTLARKGKL